MELKHSSNTFKTILAVSFAAFCLIAILLTAFSYSASVETISPQGHQPIKAKVLNEDPAYFTINVKSLANWGANDEAPTFAVYVSSTLPKQCGDFLKLRLKYTRPEKHHRRFDLSKHPQVLDAIHTYKCVVIRNIPSE